MKRLLITLITLLLFQSAANAAPDPSTNPVLGGLQKMGSKLYYLGNRMGLDGWFIVKDGQVQMMYATPDNKGAIAGALFSEDGANVTSLQVQGLIQTNKEVADLINSAAREQNALTGTPQSTAGAPAVNSMVSAPLSPGERLMHDLSNAATVLVGNASAPELLMVMDPHCPHCQATWKNLRDTVFKGAVHIRMVPIGTADTDNERAAAIFLGVSDPLNTWDRYVAGDKSQLAGTPSTGSLTAIRANHTVIDSWSIHDTPYLVYRNRDGKVKVVVGEPDKISTILTDLGV